jgi:hypothetical protein
MRVLAFVLALLQGQAPGDPYPRLLDRLSADYSDLDPATREQLARNLSKGIAQTSAFGHDPARVLDVVEWRLTHGIEAVRQVQLQGRTLAAEVEGWLDQAATVLSVPESFRIRERDANLACVESYLSEVAARRDASPAERATLAAQLETVANEIRTQARQKIYGAYGQAVVDKNLSMILEEQRDTLGDAVAGALTRPMTDEEMGRMLDRIRSEIGSVAPVEASSEADRRFAETGDTEVDADTPAQRLASQLAGLMYQFGEMAIPRTAKARDQRDQAAREAAEWLTNVWEPIRKDLETRTGRKMKRPDLPGLAPGKSRRPSGASPTAVPTAPPNRKPAAPVEPAGRSGRSWGGAALLGACVILLIWAIFRRRVSS